MQNLEGGNILVYTGPKGGKFILRYGKKVYLDKKSLANEKQLPNKKNKKIN